MNVCLGGFASLNALLSSEKKTVILEEEKKHLGGAGIVVKVMGTAQDGGIPHFGCYCEKCLKARRFPQLSRLISSLAILDLKEKQFLLVDATPDIRAQLDIIHQRINPQKTKFAPDSILLTHAHIGHYTGLIFFGYEAMSTHRLPVFCSERMKRFLSDNGPWSQLVQLENIKIQTLSLSHNYPLTPKITVRGFQVPHRDEYSDTLGFVISGQEKQLLFIPDIQSWIAWERSVVEEVEKVDVALLDGTFFSPDELPGRDLSKIGHPFITDSLKTLGRLAGKGEAKIFFTHLNHTNLALDPRGEARKRLEGEGFRLAEDGMEFVL